MLQTWDWKWKNRWKNGLTSSVMGENRIFPGVLLLFQPAAMVWCCLCWSMGDCLQTLSHEHSKIFKREGQHFIGTVHALDIGGPWLNSWHHLVIAPASSEPGLRLINNCLRWSVICSLITICSQLHMFKWVKANVIKATDLWKKSHDK